MFGIGFTELLLVLVVALLVLGPDKLPEVARSMAKAYNELRRTGHDLKRTVDGLDITGTIARTVEKSGAGAGADSDDKSARTPGRDRPEGPEGSRGFEGSRGPEEPEGAGKSQAADNSTETGKSGRPDEPEASEDSAGPGKRQVAGNDGAASDREETDTARTGAGGAPGKAT